MLGGCGSHVTAYPPPKTPVTQISNTPYQALLDKFTLMLDATDAVRVASRDRPRSVPLRSAA